MLPLLKLGWPPFGEIGVHVPSSRTSCAHSLGQAGTRCQRYQKDDFSMLPPVSGIPPPGVLSVKLCAVELVWVN